MGLTVLTVRRGGGFLYQDKLLLLQRDHPPASAPLGRLICTCSGSCGSSLWTPRPRRQGGLATGFRFLSPAANRGWTLEIQA